MTKRRMMVLLTGIILILMLGILPFASACTPPQPSNTAPIKVGALVSYTGASSTEAKAIESGLNYAFEEIGWQIGGRKVELVMEDETDNSATCVTKVRKLVEQDKVDVVLGPVLASNTIAVEAYLAPLGVPSIPYGGCAFPASKGSFFPSGLSMRNNGMCGYYAYDELKARKAAIIHSDFQYGENIKNGFTATFTARGGTILNVQKVPMGTVDLAPYLTKLGDADVICVLLVAPSEAAFCRQYREFGVKIPAVWGQTAPVAGEKALAQLGDTIIGLHGIAQYTPYLDHAGNKEFVSKFKAKYQILPGTSTFYAYLSSKLFFEAAKTTVNDTSNKSLIKALDGVKEVKLPWQTVIMKDKIGLIENYAVKGAKVDSGYNWVVTKTYPTNF